MRDLRELDRFRVVNEYTARYFAGAKPAEVGFFELPLLDRPNISLQVLATAGLGWDHVSVSLPFRCPTWDEMERVKRLFFRDDETAMQLHVPPADHVNHHPYCLHLWRPLRGAIPRPPAALVGPKS
jgi:hypothetical protein